MWPYESPNEISMCVISGTSSAGGRSYKRTAVCLGLLCVLLGAAIAFLWFRVTAELQTNSTKLQNTLSAVGKQTSVTPQRCIDFRVSRSCFCYTHCSSVGHQHLFPVNSSYDGYFQVKLYFYLFLFLCWLRDFFTEENDPMLHFHEWQT